MPRAPRKLTGNTNWFASVQEAIERFLGKNTYMILTETRAMRLLQQEFSDTKDEIRALLRSDAILHNKLPFVREFTGAGKTQFRLPGATLTPPALAQDPHVVRCAQDTIETWLLEGAKGSRLSEATAVQLLLQQGSYTVAEIKDLLRSEEILRGGPRFARDWNECDGVSFRPRTLNDEYADFEDMKARLY